MKQIISAKQIREISKGHVARVPIEYEAACKALEACCALDEGKCWADKADALAAWAKIYHDEKIERQARILKLRAYRRMGEIAREIAMSRKSDPTATCGGRPVVKPILRQAGLSQTESGAALALSRISAADMAVLESRRTVPAVTSSNVRIYQDASPAADIMRALSLLASAVKRSNTREFLDYAKGRANRGANVNWRTLAEEVTDYLSSILKKG